MCAPTERVGTFYSYQLTHRIFPSPFTRDTVEFRKHSLEKLSIKLVFPGLTLVSISHNSNFAARNLIWVLCRDEHAVIVDLIFSTVQPPPGACLSCTLHDCCCPVCSLWRSKNRAHHYTNPLRRDISKKPDFALSS